MYQTRYLSWQSCHEKIKFAEKGVLDRNKLMEFVSEIQGQVPFILRLEKDEAIGVIRERLEAITDDFCETPEETREQKKKLYIQLKRLVEFFNEKGYQIPDPKPIKWLYETGEKTVKEVVGNISLKAIRSDGRTEYITFDFFNSNSYSAKARIEANKPFSHPYLCMAASTVADMSAVYSVWYLKGKDDKGDPLSYPEYEKKPGSNIVFSDFGGDLSFARECAAKTLTVEEKRECSKCPYMTVCKGYRGIVEVEEVEEKAKSEEKEIRQLTSEQEAVVNFKDGALCVVAVPGAGKTHVLVSRMKKLIEDGVPAANILFLTFAKKAAGEIAERVAKLLNLDENSVDMPHVQTINGFGYEVLRSNKELLGREVKLAKDCLKKELIETVLRNSERIEGVSYSCLKGQFGLVNRTADWFECINEKGEEFFRTYFQSKVDVNGVLKAYKTYMEIFKAKGYCSYDEQVNLCVKLLEDHPEVTASYGKLYRYIMVDEFQDVSEPQMKMLRLLEEACGGNIVAVGDDDQAIYGFRGGDSRYMLNFRQYFPDSQMLFMSRNFRSNDKIVALAECVISKNHERIEKHICAGRRAPAKPLLLDAPNFDSLFGYVKQMKDGYGGKNIAIIARTNKELSAWQEYLWSHGCPCTSPKDYLIKDRVFETLFDVMSLWIFGPNEARESFSRLFSGFCGEFSCVDAAKNGESFYTLLKRSDIVTDLSNTAEAKEESAGFCGVGSEFCQKVFRSYLVLDYAENVGDCLLALLNVWYPEKADQHNYHLAIEELMAMCDETELETPADLYHLMKLLVDYEDTQRLSYDYGDAINLLTAHDAKGKEYDGVIVINGDLFLKDGDEESRRVLYVALTRARHTLVISSTGSETNDLIYKEVADCATAV